MTDCFVSPHLLHIGVGRTRRSMNTQNSRINHSVRRAPMTSIALSAPEPLRNASKQAATHRKIRIPPKTHTERVTGSAIHVPTPDSTIRTGNIIKKAKSATSGRINAAHPLKVGGCLKPNIANLKLTPFVPKKHAL